MSAVAQILGLPSENHPLKDSFMRWQCRVRLMTMRENLGRPDAPIMPELTLAGESEPMGHIITVMSKLPSYSQTPEMMQMAKATQDPAIRRDKALTFFSEYYYQKRQEFSDVFTATFPADSKGAAAIRAAENVTLRYEAYNQVFELKCKVWTLTKANPLHAATWWHNYLFNPGLSDAAVILGFEPNWNASTADPSPV